MKLEFRRLHEKAKLPVKAHETDAGLDLTSTIDFELAPGQRSAIPTGLAVVIPDGHCGLVLPRSGTAANHGVTLVNSPGLIDAGYRGELRVLLLNTDTRELFRGSIGDRIAQLVVVAIPDIETTWTEALPPSKRGDGGFGSSGR